MQVFRTGDIKSQYCNILLYGNAGSGKTPLAATAPSPIVITSEPGLLSLRSANLPYVLGRTHAEATDVLKWLSGSKEATQYQTVFYDSISALSEEELLVQRRRFKNDARKFSPETTANVMEIVKGFQFIQGKHLIMTSKATYNQETHKFEPYAAIRGLGPALPYNFDQVLFLSRHRDSNNAEYAALRCRENDFCEARDRSGLLDVWEPGNLSHIINKINGKAQ